MSEVRIERLLEYSAEDFLALRNLMGQVSERIDLQESTLNNLLSSDESRLFVVRDDDRIIGCAVLCFYQALSGRKVSVEDVVVDCGYRGRHLGRRLMEYVIEEARKEAPVEIQLTSRPSRVAANALYRSLGFVQRETNCYSFHVDE